MNAERSHPLILALVDAEENDDAASFEKNVAEAINEGFDLNSSIAPNGHTLLIKVCMLRSKNQARWASMLMNHGASATLCDDDGTAPLTFATLSGNPQTVKALLESGASVNAVNKFGESALLAAASCGERGCIDALMDHGADLSIRATSGEHAGRTALIVARACLHVEAAKLLESYDPVARARKEAQDKRRRESEAARKDAEERARREAASAQEERERKSLQKSIAAR